MFGFVFVAAFLFFFGLMFLDLTNTCYGWMKPSPELAIAILFIASGIAFGWYVAQRMLF